MPNDATARTAGAPLASTTTPASHRGWIDVNAQLGPAVGRAAGADAATLQAERAAHGIRLSLVRSRGALMGDVQTGNARLLDACRSEAGLVPIAVLAPQRTEGLADAIALSPHVAGFWVDILAAPGRPGTAMDDVLSAIARTGRPLLVPISRPGDPTAVGQITERLGIPVILVGTHYVTVVDALAAARRWPHLHLETSSLAHLRAIETAVASIGAERLLFGTGAPLRAIQSSLNAIAVARIPDDAKRAILAGNAARLFGLSSEPVELPAIRRPARAIDAHAHLGPMGLDVPAFDDAEFLAELARQTETQIAIASNVEAIESDSETGNRLLVESCARHPNLLGYLVADPNDIGAARDQIRRWGDAPGIVGIKIGCEQSQPTASAAIRDLFVVLADYGRPVKIHNDGAGWDAALLAIARAHPRLPIIIAHGGLGTPSAEGAALTESADNIYLEMCSSFASLRLAREVARRVPAHKFLFGTDAPLLEPAFVLGTYQDSGIPAEREADVFWNNAARLFGIG